MPAISQHRHMGTERLGGAAIDGAEGDEGAGNAEGLGARQKHERRELAIHAGEGRRREIIDQLGFGQHALSSKSVSRESRTSASEAHCPSTGLSLILPRAAGHG